MDRFEQKSFFAQIRLSSVQIWVDNSLSLHEAEMNAKADPNPRSKNM
jgi:hypothetical protein